MLVIHVVMYTVLSVHTCLLISIYPDPFMLVIYVCSDVHSIVCTHLFVDQYVWVPSMVFMLVMRVVL